VNQLQIDASIDERDCMRHTPAGIPIVTAKLLHQSEQVEAGVARQVECELFALAAGEIATRFEQPGLGQKLRFTGFLARKSRNSKSLVFHIIDFTSLEP
jgi:primosomal replication protein N